MAKDREAGNRGEGLGPRGRGTKDEGVDEGQVLIKGCDMKKGEGVGWGRVGGG